MANSLKEQLAHVLRIGGAPCSGKCSIARLLARQYGLRAYHCDDAFVAQPHRVTADQQPVLTKWTDTSWNELWMQSLEVLLA